MPTPARTVQFRQVQDVLDAYENWDTPHFAIWNGKQLLFAYDKDDATIDDGSQLLEQWLRWIEKSGSAGIYMLAIYKGVTKGITNATPYNGSVNFQLHDYNYSGNGNSNAMTGINDHGLKMLVDEVKAMRLELSRLQQEQVADSDDDDDDGDVMGSITKLLSSPVVGSIISQLFPNGIKLNNTPMKPTPVGQVSRINGAITDPDPNQKRMADALATLNKAVPDLPALLEQLGKLAEKQPGQFKFYMGTLMSMNL